MSLMKSLARIAAGVMVAKGVGAVMGNSQKSGSRGRTTGGGLLGQLIGGSASGASSSGGIADMLRKTLGGNSSGATGGSRGGLGDMFDQLSGSGKSGKPGGGLNDIMRNLGGGSGGSSGGGLGGLLGGLLGGAGAATAASGLARKGSQPENDKSFGDVFNDALEHDGEPSVAPTPEQNAIAGLMLKAMIQAAKADGNVDAAERDRILGEVGDLDDDERRFIRDEMAAPVDAAGLAREVPKGLERQVYLMSLLAIDFDSDVEADYLRTLADAMGMTRADVNAIHDHVGVVSLYN